MAYTALYRKLRPDNFSGLAGQEHIVRTLANQIKGNRISHAYLFSGTRGTGKTSTAKIFAKAVNCENCVDGEPCGYCDFCKMSADEASMSIYEIDAASNNGVDNIRDIIETVKYPPTVGKYKVYIIDEVHMLSTGAFNALLKTLEEPPEHVIFILATTEQHKIPPTILSRCQKFEFSRISAKDMFNKLKEYMVTENVSIDDNALAYITKLSDGAMRDALSVLDQCISSYFNQHITLENVLSVIGSVSSDYLFKFTNAIHNKDSLLCMELIEEIIFKGKDITQFVSEIVGHFRNLLVSISMVNETNALNISFENTNLLKDQSQTIDIQSLLNYVEVFSELQGKIKYASNERILLEVTCLKLCNSRFNVNSKDNLSSNNTEELEQRLKKLESQIKYNNFKQQESERDGQKIIVGKPKETDKKEVIEKAIPEDIKQLLSNWRKFVDSFRKDKNNKISAFLDIVKPCYIDGETILTLVCENIYFKNNLILDKENIEKGLREFTKKDLSIEILEELEYNERHVNVHGKVDNFDYTVFRNFEKNVSGINITTLS